MAAFVVLVLSALAAAAPVAEQVSAIERWLPTLTSIGGVLIIALVTAFKMGTKVNALTTAVAHLRGDYDELKTVVKEGFTSASDERKELDTQVRAVENTQTKLSKDVEYQGRMCGAHERRVRDSAVEPAGGG